MVTAKNGEQEAALIDRDITNLDFPLPYHNIVNCTFGRTSYVCHQLRFLHHEQCIADD